MYLLCFSVKNKLVKNAYCMLLLQASCQKKMYSNHLIIIIISSLFLLLHLSWIRSLDLLHIIVSEFCTIGLPNEMSIHIKSS